MIENLNDERQTWRKPVREAAGDEPWLEISRLVRNLRKWLGLLALPLKPFRWEWKRFRAEFVYVAAEVLLRDRQA